jgi:hypothetical protein
MMEMERNNEAGRFPLGGPDDWTDQFCTCSWCRAERWLVRQDPRSAELWQIAEDHTMAPWSVAAKAPVCPLCGEQLVAHVEGIGEPEMAIDNPFVRYIRTLRRAA